MMISLKVQRSGGGHRLFQKENGVRLQLTLLTPDRDEKLYVMAVNFPIMNFSS